MMKSRFNALLLLTLLSPSVQAFEVKSTLPAELGHLAGASSSFSTKDIAAMGGESHGGGADDLKVSPAFFLSQNGKNTPVRACYEAVPDFGLPNAELEKMIQQSFATWASYIHDKQVDQNLVEPIRIRDQVALAAKCAGDEELVFYFGVMNDEVSRFKSEFELPFGFARMSAQAPSRGVVWIVPPHSIARHEGDLEPRIPDWGPKTYDVLAALLLHEVGHVFGNGHVNHTVMTAEIGKLLENDTDPTLSPTNLPRYGKIDSEVELVLCLECAQSYPSAPDFDLVGADDTYWNYAFKTLTGKPFTAPASIRFERASANVGSSEYEYPGSGKLILQDKSGLRIFKVNVNSVIGGGKESVHLFEGEGGTFALSSHQAMAASIALPDGRKLPVTITYNMDQTKVEIKPLGAGHDPSPYFTSGN